MDSPGRGFGAVPIGQNPVLTVEYLEPDNRPTPYLETFNLNVQRELPWQMVFEIGYLGTFGHKLTPGGDNHTINQVAPDRITTGNVQRLRPFPQFTDVVIVSHTIGNSSYHGLNLKLEKRLARGLQFVTNYTWSKLLDDVESRNEIGGNAGTNAFSNQYNRRVDRGLSGNHIGHRFIASTVWELPIGRKRLLNVENAALNQIIGGWSLGLIVEKRSGSPFGVVENNGALVYPTAQTVRSDIIKPFTKNPNWRADVIGQNYFDVTAFAAPAYGTFGSTARTIAFGPGAVYADLSLLKNFRIREGHTLQFRTEMLNFPNHPNFGLPGQARGNPAFGRINGLAAGTAARVIQLGLQYRF